MKYCARNIAHEGNLTSANPVVTPTKGAAVTHNAADEDILKQWTRRLSQALQILDLEIDNNLVLNVADEAAHAVSPMAAPITTFVAGYAAGLAAAAESMPSQTAISRAADVVIAVCQQPANVEPDRGGWLNTAQ